MLVYRIETEDGQGIYGAGYGFRYTAAALADNEGECWHPSPDEEPALRDFWEGKKLSRKAAREWPEKGRREWFCGFESMEQLLEWFPKEGLYMMWNKMLRNAHRGHIVTYKVPGNQVKAGDKQVIFKMAKAEKVGSIPLERFAITG